jgi:repressor LexA
MLKQRAQDIYSFIRRYRQEQGSAPTIREIGTEFEITSTNGVRYYLDLLERAGYIRHTPGISRGIALLKDDEPGTIPVLGRVAAGQPITAEENWSGSLELAGMFGETGQLFALEIRGDSMIDAGILEGDFVIVQKRDTARPGEIIVAGLGDEATVKYYRPRSAHAKRGADHVELVAANPKYPPLVVTAESDFRILGVVRGVVRTVRKA